MRDDLFFSFSDLLKMFRKRQKITQQTLADHLGTHRNTITRWEVGDFLPDSKSIVLDIARLLSLNEQETKLKLGLSRVLSMGVRLSMQRSRHACRHLASSSRSRSVTIAMP